MSQPRSPIDPVDDRIVYVTSLLPIPPPETFEYFTRTELLEAWLAERANVEPHVGGLYELFWQPDDPENDSTIGCRITAFAQDQMISFQWRSPRQFKTYANGADPLTHVVVSVVLEDDGGSFVHLVHSGWRSCREWEEARVWQQRAWETGFDRLDRVVTES